MARLENNKGVLPATTSIPSHKTWRSTVLMGTTWGFFRYVYFYYEKNPTIYDKNTRNPKSTRIERNVFELFWGLAWVVV